jgi:ribosomal protein L37AE/L43A
MSKGAYFECDSPFCRKTRIGRLEAPLWDEMQRAGWTDKTIKKRHRHFCPECSKISEPREDLSHINSDDS